MQNNEAPFNSEYVIRCLLNPGAVHGITPRGRALDEWIAAFGHSGERCRETWAKHEGWLRAAAREREIAPIFNGRFYCEMVAAADAQERNR